LEAVGDLFVFRRIECAEDVAEQILARGSIHFILRGWRSPMSWTSG
jgi:hypothetical protein